MYLARGPRHLAHRPRNDEQERAMDEAEIVIITPEEEEDGSATRRESEAEEKEVFSHIAKPRVRYDVEVVTKMVIYSGKWHLAANRLS